MNELQIKGNWNVIKGKLKQVYGELTDDDLAYSEGNEDQRVGRLKSSATKEESSAPFRRPVCSWPPLRVTETMSPLSSGAAD
jgi:uncharacterized protein YjbJ (UPF0337 family)